MISLSIKTEKIEKAHLIEGKNGKILSVVLFENKDGKGQYGDDGFVVQSVSKEARENGVRGPICGNWRYIGQGAAVTTSKPKQEVEDDSVPF
jgi:hypothetical protein